MMFTCGCCRETMPEMFKHVHHKIPRSVGGPDTTDNLIELCPGCHDALHAVANKMLSKKSMSMVADQIQMLFPNNIKAQSNCMELASIVRDSTIRHRETNNNTQVNKHVVLNVTLKKKHKDLIALKCKELGVSQDSYVRCLILQHLKLLFPGAITQQDILNHKII